MLHSLHNSTPYSQFIHWFDKGVPAERFCMGIECELAPGLWKRNLASWARTFTQSRMSRELHWHQDPCEFLGFGDKPHVWFNLVMGRGDEYALDLLKFDELDPTIRKEVAVNAVCGVSNCGSVPWFSSLRERVPAVEAAKLVMWRHPPRG